MDSDEEAKPTSQAARSIKAISKDTVHRICSGQVTITSNTDKFQLTTINHD